jgi:hypothetical protein
MNPALENAKKHIVETVERLFRDVPSIRIGRLLPFTIVAVVNLLSHS